MKKVVTIVIFFTVSIALHAQVTVSNEETSMQEVITKLFEGIAELDFDKIKRNCTSDVIVLESGAVWTMDTLTTKLEPLKKMQVKRTNTLKFIKTDIKGNTGWVIYNNRADMSINGRQRNIDWLESAVLVKEGQDWKVKLLHSTTVRQNGH